MKATSMSARFIAAVLGLFVGSPVLADDEGQERAARRKADMRPRIIEVDLEKLPAELARRLLEELAKAAKGGKDHSKSWHRPYDFSRMPPGIADKMFARLPPGIAKKVLVRDGAGRRYDWSRMPPGIADKTYGELPPGIAKKVLAQGDGKGKTGDRD
jgi:hypothetical protein